MSPSINEMSLESSVIDSKSMANENNKDSLGKEYRRTSAEFPRRSMINQENKKFIKLVGSRRNDIKVWEQNAASTRKPSEMAVARSTTFTLSEFDSVLRQTNIKETGLPQD